MYFLTKRHSFNKIGAVRVILENTGTGSPSTKSMLCCGIINTGEKQEPAQREKRDQKKVISARVVTALSGNHAEDKLPW